jgi:hypothetical protein
MSPKTAIIIVVVLVVLFVVGLGLGATHGNDSQSGTTFQPSGFLQGMGDLLSPLSPKLQLGRSQFVVQVGNPQAVSVASSHDGTRRGTFHLANPSPPAIALITYCESPAAQCAPTSPCPPNLPPNPSASDLKVQCLRLARPPGNGDPRTGSLSIQSDGGIIRFDCFNVASCTIQVQ